MKTPAIILIVDDVATNRETLGELLAEDNYRIVEAVDGPAALRLAAQIPPDLVLLDVMMPGMDGFEVCRRLRADADLAAVPVVMITALDDQPSRLAGINAGADDFIAKPFNRVELRARVHSIVRLNRYRRLLDAQAGQQASEERYRLLFESNPVPMWLSEPATRRFLAVNSAAVRAYGYTHEEFLAMTTPDIQSPEEIPAAARTLVLAAAAARSHESRHRRKDGTIMPVEIITTTLWSDGRETQLVLASDLTEKKQWEAQLLHAQRLESLGMLAAGIVHDLNNVLAPIVMAAPMLRDSLSTPRDLRILDTLEHSADRGAGLVRQILGFAQGAAGEFRLTQVKHLARDLIEVIEATFPKSLRFLHEIPTDLWPVEGNATQIHQVLLNLCVNARDAMPQGGTLRLAAANRRLDAAAAAAIPGARPGSWLRLEVTDTGTGIAPEVLRRIGTPFFTTKAAGKGTGLGISTIRGIVARHHGFLEIQTVVGQGSTFRVYFPAIESEAQPPDRTRPAALSDGHGECLLVVEDDTLIREDVADLLTRHGYRVLSCADGEEAIAVFAQETCAISAVLTDVDMPRCGGVALARALQRLRPDLRILAMSGTSPNAAGASDLPELLTLTHAFLHKPFKPDELLGALHDLLAGAEPVAALEAALVSAPSS